MANKTKKEYKTELRARIKAAMVATYHTHKPHEGLRYWIDFNKAEKEKFDAELKKQGITVDA